MTVKPLICETKITAKKILVSAVVIAMALGMSACGEIQ